MKTTFMYTLISACLITAAVGMPMTSAMAQTDEFQFEVAALYIQEKNDDFKFQAYGGYAGYHFTPVPLSSLPWAEAAFLARSSSISIGLIRTDYNLDFEGLGEITGDGYMVSGNIEFFVPATPLYLSADLIRMKTTLESTNYELESVNTDFSGRIGILPIQGVLIGALYGRSVDKRDGAIATILTIDEEDTTYYYGGFLKIVQPIGGNMAFGIDLTAQRINTETKDNTGGDPDEETSDTNVEGMLAFYPVAQLGLGVTLEIQRGDTITSEGNTYGMAAIFFPMPNVGIMFSYSRFKPANDVDKDDNEILESNSFDVSVRARF